MLREPERILLHHTYETDLLAPRYEGDLETFVKKHARAEGFVLKRFDAPYIFSSETLVRRNPFMMKFKVEHTRRYVCKVGLRRSQTLPDEWLVIASGADGGAIRVGALNAEEYRSAPSDILRELRTGGAAHYRGVAVNFDARIMRRVKDDALYVQFVRVVKLDGDETVEDFTPASLDEIKLAHSAQECPFAHTAMCLFFRSRCSAQGA